MRPLLLFDLLYQAKNRKKICRLNLDPDPLDDKSWSIEEFYEYARQYFDRPCEFFRYFMDPAEFTLDHCVKGAEQTLQHMKIDHYCFRSPIQTEWKANNLVPFRWFVRNGKRSNVILLFTPGWRRDHQRHEERMCDRLRKQGIDAGLLTKPFHQTRTPPGAHSGEYFISSNLYWTIANFRQLTAEIRLLVQYMKARYQYVGLIGMSSGGGQAGLAANCEEVEFLFPFMSGCQLGSITWNGLITNYIRSDLERRGVTESELNKVWSITDQAVVGGHCKARHIKQYVTRFDRVIRTEYQDRLWHVYGKPPRLDLPSGHYSCYFYFNRVIDDRVGFVREHVASAS